MSIRSALTSVVSHRLGRPEAATARTDSPGDLLELRLAPYTVTTTTISIPGQRQGGSTASTDLASTA